MAKAKKNSYRRAFTIDGVQRCLYLHTKNEQNSVDLHFPKLIRSRRSGVPCLDSEEWAASLPQNSNIKAFLIRWGLIEDNANHERTLKDLFDHFQNRNVKPGTLKTYKDAFQNLFDCFGSDKLLRDLTPQDAGRFEAFLTTDARLIGKGTLAKATVKKRIERVRQFFLEAVRLEWIEKNPFVFIHGGNLANPEKWLYIPKAVVLEVMASVPNLELRAKIALCRFAGARGESEFRPLEWNSNWIIWSADGKQGTIRLHRTKTEDSGFSDTIIPMVPELEAALRDLFDAAAPGSVKMFTSRSNPGKVIKDKFLENGIDIRTPYNLRRSYCRDLMEAGIDPKSYEYFCGHSLRIALKHYQSWDELRAQKAAPKILTALGGSSSDSGNSTAYFTTYPQHTLQHRNHSRTLEGSGDFEPQTLRKRDFSQEMKNPSQEVARGTDRGYTI